MLVPPRPPAGTPAREASCHIRYQDILKTKEARDGFAFDENTPYFAKITKGHDGFEVLAAEADAISAAVTKKAENPREAANVFPAWQKACPEFGLERARRESGGKAGLVLDAVVASIDALAEVIKPALPEGLSVDETWCAMFKDQTHFSSDGITRVRLGHRFRAGVTSGETKAHQDWGNHPLVVATCRLLEDGPLPDGLFIEFALLSDDFVYADDGPYPRPQFDDKGRA